MDAPRDYPLSAETIRRNKTKACFAIQGIASGLVADKRLNKIEVLYLESWVRQNEKYADDPDIVDIRDLIKDILEDGVVTQEELDDLKGLLGHVVECRDVTTTNLRNRTNQLLGLLEGLSADEVLNDKEIQYLNQWLSDHPELTSTWPASSLIQQLQEVLSDGYVSPEERSELLASLKSICGSSFQDTGVAGGLSARGFCDSVPEDFSCSGLRVCLTGNFLAGRRRVVTQRLNAMGAEVCTSMSRKVDVLLVGSLVSPDWLYSSAGHKIQDAMRLKEGGHSVMLIAEEDLLSTERRAKASAGNSCEYN